MATVFKKIAFVVALKADEMREFFLKTCQPSPHPEEPSPAIIEVDKNRDSKRIEIFFMDTPPLSNKFSILI